MAFYKAGDLTKAVRQTGGVDDFVNTINNALVMQREKKRKADALAKMAELNNQFDTNVSGYGSQQTTQFQPTQEPNNNVFKNTTGEIDNILEAATSPKKINMFGASTQKPKYTQEQQFNNAQSQYNNVLSQLIGDENFEYLDPKRLAVMQQLLGSKVEQLRPETFSTPVNDRTVGFMGSKGNIKENPYYSKKETPIEMLLGEKVFAGQPHLAYGYKDGDNEIVTKTDQITVPKKGSGPGSGGEDEDFAVDDFAKVMQGIRSLKLKKDRKPSRTVTKKGEDGKDLNENFYTDEDDTEIDEKEFIRRKEIEKTNYIPSANKLVQKEGLNNFVEAIRNAKKAGLTSEEALTELFGKNKLGKRQQDALRAYFSLMEL